MEQKRIGPSKSRVATQACLREIAAMPVPLWSYESIDAYRIHDPQVGLVPASDVVRGDLAVWNLYYAYAHPVSSQWEHDDDFDPRALELLPREVIEKLPRVLRYRFTLEGHNMWSLKAWMVFHPAVDFLGHFSRLIASIVGGPLERGHRFR